MSRLRSSSVGVANQRPKSFIERTENTLVPKSERRELDDLSDEENDEPTLLGQGKLQRYGGFDNLLESFVANRPSREDLIARNILKDDKISPRLAAAQDELKKKKLEDSLRDKLEKRANVTDLLDKNIIKDPAVSSTLQAKQEELRRQKLEDDLNSKLRNRVPVEELVNKDILKVPTQQGQ